MSEEKLYAVKNDEGQYFDIDLPPWWDDKTGIASKRIDLALGWAKKYGGHVVTLIEEPEKAVLTKEQAKIVEGAHEAMWPACEIFRKSDDEELLMNAYVNGYTVAKEKKYIVKVPHTDDSYFYKIDDEYCNAGDSYHLEGMTDKKWFTDAEIEHYGLQNCERVEVKE